MGRIHQYPTNPTTHFNVELPFTSLVCVCVCFINVYLKTLLTDTRALLKPQATKGSSANPRAPREAASHI